MSIKRKALRNENRTCKSEKGKISLSLKQRLLRGGLALGFAMAPWAMAVARAEIVRVDEGITDTVGDNVHNIYAGQVKGNNAINRFDKFNLPANQIANMYFKTKGGTTEASTLYNFVNSKINIDGTVNALRNNNIGGHMYFLSKDGLTLGASGVINAGALTIMNGVAFPSSNDKGFDKLADLQKLKLEQGNGSIEINGKINAVDLVNIVSNYKLDIKSGAAINTVAAGGKKDFTNLVNIGNINSGLRGKLELARSQNSKGNIALVARASDYNENSSAIDGWMDTATKNTVGAHVNIEANTEIKAAGEASVGAYADNIPSFGNLLTFGNIGQSDATINIKGTIEGDTVNIASTATNDFTQSFTNKAVTTGRKFATEYLQRLFNVSVGLEVDVVGLKANSNITIEDGAKITATGKDSAGDDPRSALNLQSTSNVIVDQGAAGNSRSDGNDNKRYFGFGVLVSRLENDAKIEIKGGNLTTTNAEGSITAQAAAATETDLRALAAPNNTSQSQTAYVTAALNVATGYTNSLVKIADKASLNSAKDVKVLADTELSTSNLALVTNAEDVKLSTSFLYMEMDTKAEVDVDGDISAAHDLELQANNEENIFTWASNNISYDGDTTWVGYLADYKGGDYNSLVNTVIGGAKNLFTDKGIKSTKPVFESDGWTSGASINVTLLKNEADVKIGNTADLRAENDIKLDAKQSYSDLYFVADGSASEIKNPDNGGRETVVSAAIGYLEKDDTADVSIAGAEGTNNAKLTAQQGSITINSETDFTWNRFNSMVDDLKASWDAVVFKDVITKNAEGEKVPQEVTDYYANPTVENFEKLQLAILNDPGFFDYLGATADMIINVGLLVRKASYFVDAASYVNANVGTTVRPDSENAKDISVAISGAVLNYKSHANVVVGRNAELQAGKNIDITSKAKQVDANYFGATQGVLDTFGESMGISEKWLGVLGNLEIDLNILPGWSSSKGDVYGGNLGVTINDIQSTTLIAEGAKLTAQNVKANADTDLQRVLVTLGGGAAGETGVTGMLSVNTGATNSIVSIDNESKISATGKEGLSLKADNDALLVNVDGDITVSSNKAIGASFGYSQSDVITAAAIHDNDRAALDKYNGKNKKELTTEEKRELEILEALGGVLSDTQKGYLGNTSVNDAVLNVSKLSITATSTPRIISVGLAGAASKKETSYRPGSAASGSAASGRDLLDDSDMIEMREIGADEGADDNLNDILDEINDHDNDGGANDASFTNLIGAGTVEIARMDGVTAALLENANVNFVKGSRDLDLYAYEDGMAVSVAGAMALKTGAKEGASSTYMLAGTSAVNAINLDVISQIKQAKIKDALSITNEAKQAETIAAAAAPLSIDVTKNDNKGFATAVNASVNLVDNHVHANLDDNSVSMTSAWLGNLTKLQNAAYDKSTQVTGAVSVEVAKTTGLGINAVFTQLKNDVQANVHKGTYMSMGSFDNAAAANLTQVNAAAGVAAGSGKATVGAIWSHVELDNKIGATIDGATITAASVQNKAFDGDIDDTKKDITSWTEQLKGLGIDGDGSEYMALVGSSKVDLDVNTEVFDESVADAKKYDGALSEDEKNGEYTKENYTSKKLDFTKEKKTTIVNGALAVSAGIGEKSKAAVAVAVTDSVIDNDYEAVIKNAKVLASDAAKGVSSTAKNDNLIVDFASGISGTGKKDSLLSGAGSAAAIRLRNDTLASIEDSEISSGKTTIKAENGSENVAVAGSIDVGVGGSKIGIGLSVAVNDMQNTTTAKAVGSVLQGYSSGTAAIDIQSINHSDIKTIAAGVTVSGNDSWTGALGNVAVNVGHNNTKALVDNTLNADKTVKSSSKINNASKVKVYAEDTTEEVAAAAGADVAGSKAAVGLSFAVNQLDHQNITAALNNTAVKTAAGAVIDVATKENMTLNTIAVGAGVTYGENFMNFQGAGSITLARDKQNIAEIDGSTIEASAGTAADASVAVKAYEDNYIIATGDTISASFKSGSGAAIGIGAVGIDLASATKARINNTKKLAAKDVEVNAFGKQKIYDVAVGLSASGEFVNGAASLSFNLLNDNVAAEISGSNIDADNTVAVLAKGQDELINVTGGLDLGFKSTVGIGAAVGYNKLSGDVTSTVSNSRITALGKGAKAAVAHEYTTDNDNKIALAEKQHKGLVIDAYSKHDVTDVVVSAGLAVNAESAAVKLNGLGATTTITGKTGAYLKDTNVNQDNADTQGDVVVNAYDDAILHDVAVNVATAFGNAAGVSVGAAVAMADFDRTIEAKTSNGTINAAQLVDAAGGKTFDHMVTVGVDAGASATVGVGVGALVDSVNSTNTVSAEISQVNSSNDGVTLKAAHDNYINYTGVGAVGGGGKGGIGLGVAAGIVNDNNTINGTLDKVAVTHRNAAAVDYLAVTNYSKISPDLVAVCVGAGIAGAAVNFAVDSHTTEDSLALNVKNSSLGLGKKAKSITAKVDNNYEINKTSVNVSLAAALGVGFGKNFQPITINSTEVLNVTGSNLLATDSVNLEAKETRHIDMNCVVVGGSTIGGIADGATTVVLGGKQQDVVTTQNNGEIDDELAFNIKEHIEGTNEAVDSGKQLLENSLKTAGDRLSKAAAGLKKAGAADEPLDKPLDITMANAIATAKEEIKERDKYAQTGTEEVSGVAVKSSNTNVAASNINISAITKDDIDIYAAVAAFGVVGSASNIASLNEKVSNKVELLGGTYVGKDISVLGTVTGTSKVRSRITTVSGGGFNGACSTATIEGKGNSVTIEGAKLTTDNSLLVRALHDADYYSYTDDYGVNIIQGGYLEATTKDELNNKVSVSHSQLINKGTNEPTGGTASKPHTNTEDKSALQAVAGSMEIAAMKMNKARTETFYGGVNGVGGLSNAATSEIDAENELEFKNNNVQDKGDGLGVLDLYSRYSAVADTKMTFGGGSIIAGGGGIAATAKSKGEALLKVSNNSFDVANLQAHSLVTGIDDNILAKNHSETINIALGVGVGINKLETVVDTKSQTAFTGNSFAAQKDVVDGELVEYKEVTKKDADGKEYKTYEPVYAQVIQETGKTALDILAETNAKADSKVLGVNVGGVLAVGHNNGKVTVNENTLATLEGEAAEATRLKSLNLKTKGVNDVRNEVYAGGGGIFNISPYAATAENSLSVTNDVELKGKFQVAGAAAVEALQTDNLEIQANTQSGGVIMDVAGGYATNTRNENSHTKVSLTGAELEAESASITAHNSMNLNKDFKYGMKGGSGGTISCASPTTFTNTITEAADVTIGGNSKLITAENLHVQAATENSIFTLSLFENGGLLAGSNEATVNNTLNYTNKVDVQSGSQLQTKGAAALLDIDSVDNTLLQAGSYAHAYGGLLTVATPSTYNTVKRNNLVNIAGSVSSANDLSINAGQYADSSIAGLKAVIDVMAYAGGIIPGTSRKLENSIEQHNKVTISGSTTSIADTNIYANEGAVDVTVNNISASAWSSDKNTKGYVSSSSKSAKPADVSLKGENKVELAGGTVVAGAKHKVELTIGTVGEIIIINDEERDAFNDSNLGVTANGRASDLAELVQGAADLDGEIEFKTVDLSSELYAQYVEQQKLVAEYSTNQSSEAYAVAVAKLRALESQLFSLGFASCNEKGEIIPTGPVKVDVVVIPELTVSGGNVNISSQDLVSQSGTVKAYGKPTASIVNNTNLYLLLNDINVGEQGGSIKYNATQLSSIDASVIQSLNEHNKQAGDVSFKELYTEAGAAGIVDIQSKYQGETKFDVKTVYEGEAVTAVAEFMPNIELSKGAAIVNKSGNVKIFSAQGDIILNGSVSGKQINVAAAKGSMYQNSVQGLVTIGADVKQQYKSLVDNVIANENTYLNNGDDKHKTGTYVDDKFVAADKSKGTITGNSVFISADAINVNGIIQSGYEEYRLDVGSDADLARIEALNKKYANSSYTDDEIIRMGGSSEFVIVAGGQVYNSAKDCYDYQVPVYYNPTSKKLLVPEVEGYGGNISLTGRIASTGDGRLVAMDGTYSIAAKNTTNYDLKLYGLITTNVEGKITIVDTAKHQQTEITKKGYTVKDFETGAITSGDSSNSYTYKPLEGQRYSWLLGKEDTTRTYYEHKCEQNWWGARDSVDEMMQKGDYTKTSEVKLDNTGKSEGDAISVLTGYDKNFAVSLDKQQTTQSKSSVTETRWTTGLFGFRKHQLYEWYVDTGHSYTYNASVDASKDIKISFIGNAKDKASVSVTSGGSIDVHGNIGNADNRANINITSNKGGIYQDKGYLKGDNVALNAVGAMAGINILADKELTLSATNKATADTTYWRNGESSKTGGDGNAIDINVETRGAENLGTVKLVGVNGNAADNRLVAQFAVTANGSIVSGTDTAITASRVDLTALNGSIGTEAKAILVNTGDVPVMAADSLSASLNAQAKGDIYLQEASGDLRIGKIYSDEGDVSLSGPANLVDALPYDAVTNGRTEDELIELWQSLGLLEDKQYQETTTVVNDNPVYIYETVKELQEDGTYKSVTKQVHATDSNGNKLYAVNKQSQAWDAKRLLYAISDAIINPEPGVELPTKVTNIKAKNLSLDMGDSAGLNSAETTVYKISELGMYDDLHDLKDIARADARDVSWDAKSDTVTITKKLPVGVMVEGEIAVNAGQKNGAVNTANNISGNVYLDGRKESLGDKQAANLKLEHIYAKGDVFIANASGSVLNANADPNKVVIRGKNLIIDAGPKDLEQGSIGEYDNTLNIDIDGVLNATSNAGIYIKQIGQGALKLQGIASKGNIYLTALNDIISDSSLGSSSYIKLVNNGVIALTSEEGNVGTQADWVRVLNGEQATEAAEADTNKKLRVQAAKAAYIKGMSNAVGGSAPSGTLYVEDIAVGAGESINLDANGSILFVDAHADIIDAKAALNVLQKEIAKADGTSSGISADMLRVQAVEGISLNGSNNKLHKVALFNSGKAEGIKEDANAPSAEVLEKYQSTLCNSGEQDLEIIAVGKSASETDQAFTGDLTIINKAQGSVNDVNLLGKAAVEANFTVENEEGSINVKDNGTAKAEVSAAALELKAAQKVVNAGFVQTQNNLTLWAENLDIENVGSLTAANGDIKLTAAKGTIKNDIAGSNASITVAEKGNIELNAYSHVINKGKLSIEGAGNISLTSGDGGSVFSLASGELYTASGNIDLHATSNKYSVELTNEAVTNADADKLLAGNVIGAVINSADAAAMGGTFTVSSDNGSVFNFSDLRNTKLNKASQDIKLSAVNNRIYNNIDLYSDAHVALEAKYGLDNFSYNIYGAGGVSLHATAGNVINGSVIESSFGNIELRADQGDVQNLAGADLVTTGGNVVLHAGAGNVENRGNLFAGTNADVKDSGSIILKADQGDVYNCFDFDNITTKDGKINAKYNQAAKQYELNGRTVSIAANNLTLSAVEGKVYNEQQQLKAGGDVTLEAKDGMSNFAYDVEAGRNITLVATDGLLVNNAKLVAESGIIKLEAKNGSVVNMLHGDAIAKEGSVAMISGAGHLEQLQLVDTKGVVTNLTVNNVAASGSASDLQLNVNGKTKGNDTILVDKYYKQGNAYVRINNNVDVTELSAAEKASIVTVFYQVNDANNTKHLVTGFTADGRETVAITVNGVTMQGLKGDLEAFRQGDLINRGEIVAGGGSVALKSAAGNIINYDNYELFNGQENTAGLKAVGIAAPKEIKSHLGTSVAAGLKIYNNMDINAGEDLTISGGDAVISGQGYNHLYALGKLIIESSGAGINNKADLVGEKGIVLRAYEGITNTGKLTSQNGVVELLAGGIANSAGRNTEKADLVNSGDINAGSHVRVETNVGDIRLTGVDIAARNNAAAVEAEQKGYINIATTKGNIEYKNNDANKYDLTARADAGIEVSTGYGSIDSYVDYTSGANIKLNAVGNETSAGRINQTGKLQAGSFAVDEAGYAIAGSGDIIVTGTNDVEVLGEAAAAGKIAFASANGNTVFQGRLNAGNTIALKAAGAIAAKGTLRAENAIAVGENADDSHAASVSLHESEVTSRRGNITLSAEGSVSLAKTEVTSEAGSIKLQSFTKGDVQAISSTLEAAKYTDEQDNWHEGNVELLAKQGNVITKPEKGEDETLILAGGKVNMITEQGDISSAGLIISGSETKLSTAQGDVENEAAIISGSGITLETLGKYTDEQGKLHEGKVTNNGILAALLSSDVELKAEGDIENNVLIYACDNVKMTATKAIRNNGELTASIGSATLQADTSVENLGAAITAGEAITLHGDSGVTNRASALQAATGNVELQSTAGSVQNHNSAITAKQGWVNLTAQDGITNGGLSSTLTAGGDIVLATQAGNVINEGAATTTAGKIVLSTQQGEVRNAGALSITGIAAEGTVKLGGTAKVENTGAVKAQGQVDIVATKGSVYNAADISTTKDGVNINAHTGEVENFGDINAVGAVTLGNNHEFSATNVSNYGSITSEQGSISLKGSGDIINDEADLKAKSDIVLQSTGTGNVENYEGTLEAQEGSITLKAQKGNVINYISDANEYSFVGDRALTAAERDTIEVDGSSMYALDENGSRRLVEARSINNLIAENDVSLVTAEGNIFNDGGIEAKTGAIAETATKGFIYNMGDLAAQGDVALSASDEVKNIFADISSKTGNVILESTESGSVYNWVSNIQAENAVSLTTKSGDIVNLDSDITAAKGAVTMQAAQEGDIYNFNSALTADAAKSGSHAVSLTTAKGELVNFGSDITASGNVVLQATSKNEAGEVFNISSAINAGGAVTIEATQGAVLNDLSAIAAKGKVTLQGAHDVINVDSAIMTTSGDVELISTASGDVSNYNSAVRADNGKVSITANSGAVENVASAIAANDEVRISGTEDVILSDSAVQAKQGDVSITSTSTAHGELMLANSNITAGTGKGGTATVSAENGDVIIRNSDIRAGSAISMESNTGNISNFNIGDVVVETYSYHDVTVTANRNVDLASLRGNIKNYGVTTAEKEDVSITAFNGYVVNYANITADGGTISLAAYNPGNAPLDASDNSKGDVRSLNTYNSNTTLSAGKGVDIYAVSDVQNDSDVTVENGNINIISVNSTVNLGVNSNNENKMALYTVEKTGNIVIKADKDITNQTVLKIGDVAKKTGGGNIYLTSTEGGITNQANAELVTANGNISMLADKNIINNGESYARGGEIYIESTSGYVKNTDDFDKYKGQKTDMATSDITILAKQGDLYNEHNLVSGGNITLAAKTGLENFSYYLSAIGDVSLTATDGDLINSSAILSQQGSIYLTAEKGAVVNLAGGKVTGFKAYDPTTDSFSSVEVAMKRGDLYALGGDVILSAGGTAGATKTVKATDETTVAYGSGDVLNMGSLVALGSHKITDNNKEICNQTFTSNLTAEYYDPGMIGMYSKHGNVINKDAEYNTNGERKESSLQVGNSKYMLSLGDVDLEASEGYLLNNFNIAAGGSVRAIAKEDVTFNDSGSNDKNNIVIAKVGGDLGISSIAGKVDGRNFNMTANGNILIEGFTGVELNSDVTSLTGSVMIAAANGSIYREVESNTPYDGNVYALNGLAALGAGKGDIDINSIFGRDVVLYAPQGNITAQRVGAYDTITAQALKMKLNNIINLNAPASGKSPSIAISGDEYYGTHSGNTHFSYLNIASGNIVVKDGKLAIDKLQVRDSAHFTAFGYKVGIYGPHTGIYRDDSNAIFYDPNKGQPEGDRPIIDLQDFFNFNGEHSIAAFKDRFSHIGMITENMHKAIAAMDKEETWNKDNKGWLNLYIDSSTHARCNGILLHLKDGYYVDNARYPLDDLARILLNYSPYGVYDLYYKDHLGYDFMRYNLVEEDKKAKQSEKRTAVFNESDLELFKSVLSNGNSEYKLDAKGSK